MAIWQNKFFLIPEKNFNSELLETVVFEDNGDIIFDDSIFWKENTFDYIDQIEEILPRRISWSNDLFLFGDEESNELSIYYENKEVVSISFRIDFRTEYESVLRRIVEICLLNGFVLIDEKLNIVPLNFFAIKQQIEASPQFAKYKFLSGKIGEDQSD